MDRKLTIPSLWSIRALSALGLSLLLTLSSLTPVFAEEDSSEPVAEEPAAESEPALEPTPEPAPEPEPEPTPEPEYVPPPEALEGLGGWAEVDPNTGEVLTVIVGNVNSMEDWEGMKTRMANSGKGTVMRFQTRATPDGNVAGWNNATWDESSGTFILEGSSGDTTTRQRVVPSQTSRDANGEGRTYNIGSGIVDIETTTTKRSGETSGTLRTYRSDYQDPTVDATLELPDLGESGSRLAYQVETRTSESSERPAALDRIALDVDSLLMENGYVTTETTVDDETGEETSAEVVDSSDGFVVAIREVTRAVVEFFSSLLGFGEPRA
jgi:hypothetical protein